MALGLGESVASIAQAFGLKPDTLRKNPVSDAVQAPAQHLLDVLTELCSYFDEDWKATMIWVRKRHPALENFSPMNVIKEGDLDIVAAIVRSMGTGLPS
ncbi:MAG: hypothetical protein M3Y21_00830 [Candidatus Eremiobacteraeota bacterium]|nr:hypothetical protein [Candidatus Eremiobacteraeota bacterium]